MQPTNNKDTTPSSNTEERSLEETIVRVVEKSLLSFGFQYAVRNCRAPKHGEGTYIEENWNAETLGAFISRDIESLITTTVEKAVKEARIEGENFGRADELIKLSEWGKTIDNQWNNHFEDRIAELKANHRGES